MNRTSTLAILGAMLLSASPLLAQRGGTTLPPSVMGAGIFPVPHPTEDQFLKLDKLKKTVWAGEGPRTWKALPTVAAITANDLRSRLYPLSDDSMHGRVVATEGHVRATQMIADAFKKMGLEPGGDNGTFFQVLPYGPTSIDSTKIALSVAGEALVWKKDWSPLASGAAYGPAFNGNNVPTVFGGNWMDANTTLDPAVIKGKVVVFLPAAAAPAAAPATGRGGRGATTDLRPRDAESALVLMVNFDPAQVNMTPFAPGRGNTLRSSLPGAGASITAAAAEKIFGKPVANLKAGDVGKPISGSFDYAPHIPATPARNVIAIRRGSDPVLKNEFVVLGAHNDHVRFQGARPVEHDSLRAFNRVLKPQGANDNVVIGTVTEAQWDTINAIIKKARTIRPARLDSIMNGADDDGSGTAVLMEIAEAFAKMPAPKRTMVFVSHAGEEAGMLGSSTFTDWPTIDRSKIIAAFNMDMLGKGRAIDVNLGGPNSVQLLGSRRLSTAFGNVFDSVNATRKEPMSIDYTWEMFNRLNRFCRSDQVSYFRYDIPVTYISLGYAVDYHMATDEPQYIDYEHGARLGRFIHDVAEAVANRKERFVNDGLKQNRFQGCTTG